MTPYRQLADIAVHCEHCGCMLTRDYWTSDGYRYELSYKGSSVHTHARCVELAVIRDAVRAAHAHT